MSPLVSGNEIRGNDGRASSSSAEEWCPAAVRLWEDRQQIKWGSPRDQRQRSALLMDGQKEESARFLVPGSSSDATTLGTTGRTTRELLQDNSLPSLEQAEDGKTNGQKRQNGAGGPQELRDWILRLNRPRIVRPWAVRPPQPSDPNRTDLLKKSQCGGSCPSPARSNSSSGCSSEAQSGPASPVSSKCSSSGHEQPQQIESPLSSQKADALGRQGRRSAALAPASQGHRQPTLVLRVPLPPPSTGLRKMMGVKLEKAEEVDELSRAARRQMAILEELEFEDKERKTRISDQMANGGRGPPTGKAHATGHSPVPRAPSPPAALPLPHHSPAAAQYAAQKTVGRRAEKPNGTTRENGNSAPASPVGEGRRLSGLAEGEPSRRLDCHFCGQPVVDVVLQALGTSFHPDCFRCSECRKCLDGVPFAVDQRGGVICMADYERLFVPECRACKGPIRAANEFGQVVRVLLGDSEYHIQCYACEGCGMQLGNEEQRRCYPWGEHLLCRRCNTLWRRMGTMDSEAAVTDL